MPGVRGRGHTGWVDRRTKEHKCSSCGFELELAIDGKLRTMITGASGQPNMHVLLVDGVEVHRCEANTQIDLTDDEASHAQLS